MNGIGGRTMAEAKKRLSLSEAQEWMQIIEKYGTLHLGRRIEVAKMTIANAICQSVGWKTNPYDFTIFEKEPVYTTEDIKNMLRNKNG